MPTKCCAEMRKILGMSVLRCVGMAICFVAMQGVMDLATDAYSAVMGTLR